MTTIGKYQLTTFILVILVIVLGVMLFTEADEPVVSSLSDVQGQLSSCLEDLAGWNRDNLTGTTTPDTEARGELSDILERCGDSLGMIATSTSR